MPKSRSPHLHLICSLNLESINAFDEMIDLFLFVLPCTLFSLDADVWKKFLSRPALPFILRLLRGLATQHPPTQVLTVVDVSVYGGVTTRETM